jgi:hypothetical protein
MHVNCFYTVPEMGVRIGTYLPNSDLSKYAAFDQNQSESDALRALINDTN